jgi:hypothetical protein
MITSLSILNGALDKVSMTCEKKREVGRPVHTIVAMEIRVVSHSQEATAHAVGESEKDSTG